MALPLSSWQEFKAILESTNKKLLKKPNLPQAVKQLNALSLQMQDEELSRHAIHCHVEQARLHQKMGEPDEERKQYLIAAQLTKSAIEEELRSHSRVRSYLPDELTVYYSKAVKLSLDMKAFRLAGLTSLEASKALVDCGQFEMAAEHAQRAVRLLEGEFYTHTQALYCLAMIHFELTQWEQLLTDIDDLWMAVMKNRPKTCMGRRMLKDLEVVIVLVLSKTKIPPSGRQKLLMDFYLKGEVPETTKPSYKHLPVENTALSQSEFMLVQNFLDLLSEGKGQEARSTIFVDKSEEGGPIVIKPKLDFLSPLGLKVVRMLAYEF